MNPQPSLRGRVFATAALAVLLGGCSSLDVPRADNYPATDQKKARAVHHWDVLADDVAEELHLPPELPGAPPAGSPVALDEPAAAIDDQPLKAQVQRYERQVILRAVRLCGSKRKAAIHLGIDVGTLIRKLQRDD